jgi:DNA mismatch endonuclease (patch repair protein)
MHAGCKNAKVPSTRRDFWRLKLEGNVARDLAAVNALRVAGWRTLVVWECATRGVESSEGLSESLAVWIESWEADGEISAARQ